MDLALDSLVFLWEAEEVVAVAVAVAVTVVEVVAINLSRTIERDILNVRRQGI